MRALAPLFDGPADVGRAREELEALQSLPDFDSLVASYRRVQRLVRDVEQTALKEELFDEPAERALWAAFSPLETEMSAASLSLRVT